ncbi:MAG: hypothetical protein IKZ43_08485 [Acidaminococcaceae bacterium]|nr:hypothetical protein [Acidaminococcaceae bacterium]
MGGTEVSGWFTGSAVVVMTGCCISRETVGDVWAADLSGVRTVGATGAAAANVV